MTFDLEVSTEVAERIAEIGRSVVVPKRPLTREECTTPELRLEYIAQWLEAGAPERHGIAGFWMPDMVSKAESLRKSSYYKGSLAIQSIPVCGTVCCVAGTANVWWGAGASVYDSVRAKELLGLSEDNGQIMFFADSYTDIKLRDVTPTWAARCIRKYQREGVVDWEGTR